MHLLAEYGLFLAKTMTIVMAILMILGKIFSSKGDPSKKEGVRIKKINDDLSELKNHVQTKTLEKPELKKWKKEQKKTKKKDKKSAPDHPRLFIIRFKGDMQASQVDNLRREVTATLLAATQKDEVLICLESPGGVVHGYGLAASQLARLRAANIPLTVVVDKVAASGGYMMASVANKIIAAPFAIIGSIGVLAQIPNFHRFLEKRNIDFEQITAGKYKRTLTYFGENTEASREKMQEDIEQTHELFKDHIKQFRDELDIEKVATGEYWFGTQAMELNLIDAIQTSDDYILERQHQFDIFLIQAKAKKSLLEKITHVAQLSWQSISTTLPLAKKQDSTPQ